MAEPAVIDASSNPAPSRAALASFRLSATPSQGHPTPSWRLQRDIEQRVFHLTLAHPSSEPPPPLTRHLHIAFASEALAAPIPSGYTSLHASQPWLLYWSLHALDILSGDVSADVAESAVEHIASCRDDVGGGFGGGPGQDAHLAATYAAVAALVIVGTREAYDAIGRDGLARFLKRMKCADGGFRISERGEKDVRALYSAMAAASLAGILDAELCEGVEGYVRGLKGFDGGYGGEEGAEAHGGNTFCAVAGAAIAGVALDGEEIVDWAAMRQQRFEGGFCGRTNKLVDSCYSFWIGALFPILGAERAFNAEALQRYILTCCQDEEGGLMDKPGVAADYHHTCYALSGLSVAQHYGGALPPGPESAVGKVDVRHNVCEHRLRAAKAHFMALDEETF